MKKCIRCDVRALWNQTLWLVYYTRYEIECKVSFVFLFWACRVSCWTEEWRLQTIIWDDFEEHKVTCTDMRGSVLVVVSWSKASLSEQSTGSSQVLYSSSVTLRGSLTGRGRWSRTPCRTEDWRTRDSSGTEAPAAASTPPALSVKSIHQDKTTLWTQHTHWNKPTWSSAESRPFETTYRTRLWSRLLHFL